MIIYLAVNDIRSQALNKRGYKNRLFSYFTLKTEEYRFLEWVTTGTVKLKGKKSANKKN